MNFKNTTILAMFFCLIVPFVLLNNFYPFWRFGMFAEPVKSQVQTEKFKIYRFSPSNPPKYFSPEKIGFDENQFLYLARNYYYKSQTTFFLKEVARLYSKKYSQSSSQKVKKLHPKKEVAKEIWKLYRVVVTQQIQQINNAQKDSTLVTSIHVHGFE
ncbi:hypothetical protein BKI52_05005 [marine bacterium AO1-C]|nr:hypothetical protein BKI52_05005 [marine bacterium AO1-C]